MANVSLSWSGNDSSAEGMRVRRDGNTVVDLSPLSTNHIDENVAPGTHSYEVCATRGSDVACSPAVSVNVLAAPSGLSATVLY